MKLETSHDALVVNFSVLERVASGCLGGMRIPRDQSGRAHIDVLRHNWRQLRISGAFIPGVVKAGIYAGVAVANSGLSPAGSSDAWSSSSSHLRATTASPSPPPNPTRGLSASTCGPVTRKRSCGQPGTNDGVPTRPTL